MFKDKRKTQAWEEIRRHGFRAFQDLLPATLTQDAALAADVAIGCGSLWAPSMVMLAIYLLPTELPSQFLLNCDCMDLGLDGGGFAELL